MAKYTGRPLSVLKTALYTSLSVEEHELLEKEKAKKATPPAEPGFFGKVGLFTKAAAHNVAEKVSNIKADATVAMMEQSIREKRNAKISHEMSIAQMDILRRNGEISQAEYEEAIKQYEAAIEALC